MKKISFTCLSLLMICFAGYSQKTTFGLKAGLTTNYLSFESFGDKLHGEKTGFYFGGLANFQLDKHFALQPNLLVALKGADVEDVQFTTWHIEVPINLLYTNGGFFVGAGPNFSYGLDGRAKGEDVEPDGEVDIYAPGETDLLFRRVEIGSNVLMGYTFPNGLSLSVNYAQGFNNLYKGDEDFTIHSKTFGFSVGYMFGKKK